MKRKVLSVMLASAMLATMFAGCGNDTDAAGDAGTNAPAGDAAASTEAADGRGSGLLLELQAGAERCMAGACSYLHGADRCSCNGYHRGRRNLRADLKV